MNLDSRRLHAFSLWPKEQAFAFQNIADAWGKPACEQALRPLLLPAGIVPSGVPLPGAESEEGRPVAPLLDTACAISREVKSTWWGEPGDRQVLDQGFSLTNDFLEKELSRTVINFPGVRAVYETSRGICSLEARVDSHEGSACISGDVIAVCTSDH